MILTQHYLACLSQASYLIGDETTGRAIVVDPRRDIEIYLAEARERGLTIELIIETHVHADFVSGHLELAAATSAVVCFGSGAVTDFDIRALHDGERIELGQVVIEVRATPGHTPESISLVVYETAGAAPHAVLTGDALFIGDVGRPDLLSDDAGDARSMASTLYQSIHQQLLTLPDATLVYPGHGAGSSCGRSLSSETVSTVGEQRGRNAALLTDSEGEFVELLVAGQPVAPDYFGYASRRNRERRPLFVGEEPMPALSLEAVDTLCAAGALVLDIRDAGAFAAGHLEGSINVGLDGRFAEYAGCVVGADQTVIITGDDGRCTEARMRLARIGFDRVAGCLTAVETVLAAHPDRVRVSVRLSPVELRQLLASSAPQVLDVRSDAEREQGTIADSVALPLPALRGQLDRLDRDRPVVVHCAGGYRSSMAASLLRRHGFTQVSDLAGGYGAWAQAMAVAAAG